MASILDVAREADVAPSTVSLVCRNKGRVSAKTRKRVELAIRRLGYQHKAHKKKQHIAVLYTPNMILNGTLVQFCREWIKGIHKGLGKDGSNISVFQGQSHVDNDPMFVQSLANGDFNGLILMGMYPSDGYLEHALQSRVPLVVFNRHPKRGEFSSVTTEIYGGARTAINKLVSLGHRRIAFQGSQKSSLHQLLSQGVHDELASHGLKLAYAGPDIANIDPVDFVRNMRQVGATAVLAGDPFAKQVADVLIEQGVRVPEDVSFVGVDDMGMTTSDDKRLTSLGYNKPQMGQLAGQMIQQLIANRGLIVNITVMVEVDLTEGQTIAPSAAK